MQSNMDLDATLSKVIALYNRTRSPQVVAKLVTATPLSVTISFTGGFCYGCGITEYVEGFAQQFKLLSPKFTLKVGRTRQITPRTFEADFSVKEK